jgi:DNA-binding NtrC family response regulator
MSEKSQTYTIVAIDPDEDLLAWIDRHLAAADVEVKLFTDVNKGLPFCLHQKPDLIIVEMGCSPIGGLDVLKQVRQAQPHALVILMAAFPPSHAVIEAMKWGGYEFLKKEKLTFELKRVVEAALRVREEIRRGPAEPVAGSSRPIDDSIIGDSPSMQEVFKLVGRVSRGDAPVLITGESGSGKEVVARAIHQFSLRGKREFVAINCAAIPDNLLESELFGHEKGAFTGASARRIGRFEQCDGGTLFLDEIGDMPMQTQSKILRVLQGGDFSRVGGNETMRSDVRVLAATNRKLEEEVAAGRFREDLFYRLNVVRIHIPPLRERVEDIPALADFFLRRAAAEKRAPLLRLTDAARELLCSYDWPGNVRELENTLYRACALANTSVLLPQDIPLQTDSRERLDEALATLAFQARADGVGLLAFLERQALHYARAAANDEESVAAILGITVAALRKLGSEKEGS